MTEGICLKMTALTDSQCPIQYPEADAISANTFILLLDGTHKNAHDRKCTVFQSTENLRARFRDGVGEE